MGSTALHLAAANGLGRAEEELTSLICVWTGRKDVCRELIKNGAKINIMDKSGADGLH